MKRIVLCITILLSTLKIYASPLPQTGVIEITLYNCFNQEEFIKEIEIEDNECIFPLVGSYKISDKTTESLETTLRKLYAKSFYNSPTVKIRLRKKKTYHIYGEVTKPLSYSFEKGISLSEAIALAGLKETADDKNILIRRGNSELTVNLSETAERGGFFLHDGDMIFVSRKNRSLYIGGNIKNPGFYFLDKNDRFLDLVEKAGGFVNEDAAYAAVIERKKSRIQTDLARLMKEGDDHENIYLEDGDRVFVKGTDYNDFVYVLGAISNPGKKPYGHNLSVSDLILEAKSLATARLQGTRLIRGNKESHKIYALNLYDSIRRGAPAQPVFVQPGDIIYVPYKRTEPWENLNTTLQNILDVIGNIESLENFSKDKNLF